MPCVQVRHGMTQTGRVYHHRKLAARRCVRGIQSGHSAVQRAFLRLGPAGSQLSWDAGESARDAWASLDVAIHAGSQVAGASWGCAA